MSHRESPRYYVVRYPSGKETVCKTVIRGFDPRPHLHVSSSEARILRGEIGLSSRFNVALPPKKLMSALSALIKKPENTHFDGQEPSEEIIFLLRRHWITNVPWLFGSVVALFLPTFFFTFSGSFGLEGLSDVQEFVINLVWCLAVLGFAFEKFLSWFFNAHLVTTKRIVDIDFWGIFYTHVSETSLDKIQDCTYHMGGISQVLFNYGTITVQTAAEKREFEFELIPNPAFVHDKITDLADPELRKKIE